MKRRASLMAMLLFGAVGIAHATTITTLELSPCKNFADLGLRNDGTVLQCCDCTQTDPCAGGGDGAIAVWVNGVAQCGAGTEGGGVGGGDVSFDATNDGVNESTALTHIECDGNGMSCSEPAADEARIALNIGTGATQVAAGNHTHAGGGGGGILVVATGTNNIQSNVTRYLMIGGGFGATFDASQTLRRVFSPVAGVYSDLKCRHQASGLGASETITVTVADGGGTNLGAPSAMTCQMTSATNPCTDATNTVTVSAGDIVVFKVVTTTIASPNGPLHCGIKFTPS